MDKTGDPSYIRLPAKLELLIIEQADKEGRNKNQMIIHLIARGLHLTNYRLADYCSSFFNLEGQNCHEE
jgi:hypothetical protein